MKKKTNRKRLVAKLDNLFSVYIRMRDRRKNGGMCAFSCGRPIGCVFHFVTRSKYSVRWDVRNGCGSCSSCNYTNEFNPHPFVSWYIRQHGLDAYETLIRDSNVVSKHSIDDLEAIADDLTKKIETVSLGAK